jgi:hypothetical protein
MSKSMQTFGAVVAIALSTASPAFAQATDEKACSDQERANQTLSEKLGRTNGVICPPEVDKSISTAPPDTGKTPIIPPPGSPGGNPNVQPK